MRTPGEVIDGRYFVRGLLGRGGMAEVFRATDTETDRGVAIKMLRGLEPGSARRFRSEVDVLGRLDHPGTVRLRGSGTHEGVPYLVVVECLTGRPCYAGGHVEAALTRLHRPPDIPFDLPRWSCDVLSAMTARDPSRRPAADAAADALRRRTADPVSATTAPLDVLAATARQDGDVTTELPRTLAPSAHHDAEATTALPGLAAAPTAATQLARPANGTAVLPGGLSARPTERRRTLGGGVTTLVAGAVAVVLVVSLLVWLVAGGDTSGNRPSAASDPGPTTSVSSTTIAPAPSPAADGEAPPAGGQATGRGNGNGRGNGHGKGKD